MSDGISAVVSASLSFAAVLKIYPGKRSLGQNIIPEFSVSMLELSLHMKIVLDDLGCLVSTMSLADYSVPESTALIKQTSCLHLFWCRLVGFTYP